jgi:DNA-binding transcriptional regulator YiaG
MPLEAGDMAPETARAHLARLGLSQQAFARLFRANPRTARRWVSGDSEIPRAVAIALELLTPDKVAALLAGDPAQEAEGTD